MSGHIEDDGPAEPAGSRHPALPGVATPRPGAVLCVFDSWVWVQLAAARRDRHHELRASWEALLRATEAGTVQVSSTSGGYLELWNRADARSRARVAAAIAEVTGYVTLRAVHEVVIEEAHRLIHHRRSGHRGPGDPIPRDWVLGSGARHAFGSRTGRFRFVESLADGTAPEGPEIDPPEDLGAALDALAPAEFEWINLAGVDTAHDIPGIEYRPAHRDGDDWVRAQGDLRRLADMPGADESLLYRILVLRRLQDVFDQVGADAITVQERRDWFTGPAAGVSFITSLPTQQVLVELLYAAHRNRRYEFRQHDRIDVHELALAIPYCDVVVPDAHWAHLARATKVAAEHGTVVLQGRRAFRAWAETL